MRTRSRARLWRKAAEKQGSRIAYRLFHSRICVSCTDEGASMGAVVRPLVGRMFGAAPSSSKQIDRTDRSQNPAIMCPLS